MKTLFSIAFGALCIYSAIVLWPLTILLGCFLIADAIRSKKDGE